MSFDPIADTGEDGNEYRIFVRRKIKPGDKADKEPGLFGNVELNWTKDDHEMFSGLFKEIGKQFEAKEPDMYKICQNCGLEILHKAVREWEIDHRYLGGLGEMCQECVKHGDISKYPGTPGGNHFPF